MKLRSALKSLANCCSAPRQSRVWRGPSTHPTCPPVSPVGFTPVVEQAERIRAAPSIPSRRFQSPDFIAFPPHFPRRPARPSELAERLTHVRPRGPRGPEDAVVLGLFCWSLSDSPQRPRRFWSSPFFLVKSVSGHGAALRSDAPHHQVRRHEELVKP